MAKLKDGFYKLTAETVGSDSYMLLAGGGSKALSDFATASEVVTALGTNDNYVTWTKNSIVNNLTVPYATNADTVDNWHANELLTALSSNTTNAVSITVGGITKNITTSTLKTSLGLGNVQNTAFYQRVTTVNGVDWDMAGTNSNTAFTIYAPTTAGTSGLVLTSTAGTPGWTNQSSLSVGYASSAGNANTVDDLHASDFEAYKCTVIDTTGLNENTWYPVTFEIGCSLQTRVRVEDRTSTTGSWNNRSDKRMAVLLDYVVQGSAWGWITPTRIVYDFELGAGAEGTNCVAGLGLLTNSSTEYVYVRGGAKYNFYISRFITPVLRTTSYTVSSQTIAPTTTSPAAITTNNALKSDLTWSNVSGKPSFATVATSGSYNDLSNKPSIPTVTNYYWANVNISSSSNSETTPTFKTATATMSVTTPLVTNTGILTLNGTSGVYLKYNNTDASSLVLSSTYFKPFDSANNKISLGTSSARWSELYSVKGNFTGLVRIDGTAADQPLIVRGIVGQNGSGTIGELYLQYGANKAIMLGNTGAYSISADGSLYTGNATTAGTANKLNLTYNVGSDGSYPVIWTDTTTKANASGSLYKSAGEFYYNPSSDTLTVGNVNGKINGYKISVVDNLPDSPDASTIYFIC